MNTQPNCKFEEISKIQSTWFHFVLTVSLKNHLLNKLFNSSLICICPIKSHLREQRWNRSGFLTTGTGRPAGLKFILELLLSPDNDNWCRELETKAVYILSGRYSWDPTEVLYIFTWKKQNFNVDTRAGLPVTGRSTGKDRSTGRPASNRYRFHLCQRALPYVIFLHLHAKQEEEMYYINKNEKFIFVL